MHRKQNDNADLRELTLRDLRRRAALLKIAGRSKMNRGLLLEALERAGKQRWARGDEATSYTPCRAPAEPTAPPYLDRGKPIPDTYGDDRLCLMIRDAHSGYAYWEMSGPVTEHFRRAYGEDFPSSAQWHLRLCALRSRDISDIPVNISSYDCTVDLEPGELYRAHLGFFDEDGSFVSVLTSTPTMSPVETVSSVFDENWPIGSADIQAKSTTAKQARRENRSSIWHARFQEITEQSTAATEA